MGSAPPVSWSDLAGLSMGPAGAKAVSGCARLPALLDVDEDAWHTSGRAGMHGIAEA